MAIDPGALVVIEGTRRPSSDCNAMQIATLNRHGFTLAWTYAGFMPAGLNRRMRKTAGPVVGDG